MPDNPRLDANPDTAAAASPDPDAADLVAKHLRERWPCTCRPGMDGGGIYHAADCNSQREGSQAVLAVIKLLRDSPPASPDERLREAADTIWRVLALKSSHDGHLLVVNRQAREMLAKLGHALAAADQRHVRFSLARRKNTPYNERK